MRSVLLALALAVCASAQTNESPQELGLLRFSQALVQYNMIHVGSWLRVDGNDGYGQAIYVNDESYFPARSTVVYSAYMPIISKTNGGMWEIRFDEAIK